MRVWSASAASRRADVEAAAARDQGVLAETHGGRRREYPQAPTLTINSPKTIARGRQPQHVCDAAPDSASAAGGEPSQRGQRAASRRRRCQARRQPQSTSTPGAQRYWRQIACAARSAGTAVRSRCLARTLSEKSLQLVGEIASHPVAQQPAPPSALAGARACYTASCPRTAPRPSTVRSCPGGWRRWKMPSGRDELQPLCLPHRRRGRRVMILVAACSRCYMQRGHRQLRPLASDGACVPAAGRYITPAQRAISAVCGMATRLQRVHSGNLQPGYTRPARHHGRTLATTTPIWHGLLGDARSPRPHWETTTIASAVCDGPGGT